MSDSEPLPQEVQKEIEKPQIEDPRQLIALFRESPHYKAYYEKFYAGKNTSPSVTEERKKQVFEEDDTVINALFDFAQRDIRFRYEPQLFPESARRQITNYIEVVKSIKKSERSLDRHEIESLDKERSLFHNKAAQSLIAEGIVNTTKLGRGMVSLILINKGYDNYYSASTPTSKRVENMVA